MSFLFYDFLTAQVSRTREPSTTTIALKSSLSLPHSQSLPCSGSVAKADCHFFLLVNFRDHDAGAT